MQEQLLDHCNTNSLLPDFQLAYHQYYSTETSLINITNDILWGNGKPGGNNDAYLRLKCGL